MTVCHGKQDQLHPYSQHYRLLYQCVLDIRTHWVYLFGHSDCHESWILGFSLHWGRCTCSSYWPFCSCAHLVRETQLSTHRPTWCMTSSVTLGLTLILKSCKDISLGEVPGDQVWVLACLILFSVFSVILSLVSLAVPLLLSWVLVWIASIS
jgi:hypothetical protein